MRKFSKINENKINDEEIESILDESGFKYEIIHDYYYNNNEFSKSIDRINEYSNYSKVIIIDPDIVKNSINIEEWNKHPMKFRSSSFSKISNIDDAKEKYNRIFDLVGKLKINSPNLIFKEDKVIITLIGEKVSKSDIDLKNKITITKRQLYLDLKSFIDDMEIKYLDVASLNLYTEQPRLYLHMKDYSKSIYGDFKNWEVIWGRLIKTLEIQKSNYPGREWMKDIEEIEGLNDIRDYVNEEGFYIELLPINDNKPGRFLIELIEF